MDKSGASSSSWSSMSTFSMEKQSQPHDSPFSSIAKNLSAKSAKVSALPKGNLEAELSLLLQNMPADKEALELVLRFCRGHELICTSENVIQLICLSNYLEMTENHSRNNLLKKVMTFFQLRVLPSWDKTIKALRSAGTSLQESVRLGLFKSCLESLAQNAWAYPNLLGKPFKNSMDNEDSDDEERESEDFKLRPNAKRRLFKLEWESEDLTALPLQLYEPIIFTMNEHQVPPNYVAASLCRYIEKWAFSSGGAEDFPTYSESRGNVIEAVERLLPNEKGLVPCTLLFQMLKFAISLESSDECRNGLENRIGKQLEQATVNDILIPFQGCTKEMHYDIECLTRILKHFYGNYSYPNSSNMTAVALLIEEFLLKVSSNVDLKINTFVELGKMSMVASLGTQETCDGIYRAVDIYLDKHRHLTESEKEEVCRILECRKMSPEACEHATQNQRLPLRFVVQVLFISQMQMRNTIANQVQVFNDTLRIEGLNEYEAKERTMDFDEEEVISEMEKMSVKVTELENASGVLRKEIENGSSNQHRSAKVKTSAWKELKRKLGCMTSSHDSNCQVKKKKKVHPKY